MDPAHRSSRLLERQVRKATRADGSVDLELLTGLVGEAYLEFDRSRQLHEHAVSLVSRELAELHQAARATMLAQRREGIARVFAMLDEAVEGVVALDAQGLVTNFSRSAERIFRCERAEVIGRRSDELFEQGPEGAAAFESLIEAASAEALSQGFETRGLRRDGEVFDAEVSCARLEVDGEITLVGLWRDVSVRKAHAAALEKARQEAEAANQAKSEFLAAMSHEIRTPLNGVLGMAAALERSDIAGEQRAMVKVILESGQTLMTLLSDILDLSKIEAGRLELEETPFDFEACVQAVATLFSGAAEAKKLGFEVQLAEGARGAYLGDPTRIRQVLQNLVSNALKFTDSGGILIAVEAEELGAGRARLRVGVHDTGVGISEAARGKLFQKFAQADASTTRRFGGTGLGLSICRELIGAMGGEVGVESREGEGSEFWFTLPLERSAGIDADAEAAQAGPCLDGRLRILAADDNATNRLVLATLLKVVGLEADFVENGREAVDAMAAAHYDLVLMDVHMPVMDGVAATRLIRAMPGPRGLTPIVAVSADAMPEQIRAILAHGMDAHVAKPLKPEALILAIEEALMRRQPPAGEIETRATGSAA